MLTLPLIAARRGWLHPLAVAALLAVMAVAMVTTALQQTPTIDEPVYVGAAVEYGQQHHLVHNPEHPPLGKLIMWSGLAFADVHLDPAYTATQEQLGRHVLYGAGNNPWWVMLSARLPMILLTLLFGLVVYAFARDVTGPVGGLVALALYAFAPDVITHGSLATLDVPAAGFVLTSAWLLWRARKRPRPYLPLAGVALGAALATRASVLPAVPVLLLLAVLSFWSARREGDRRVLGRAVLAAGAVALIAVAVVWVTYLVVDPRLRWDTPATVADIGGLRGLVVDLAPFPAAYRDGMRIQFGFEDSTFQGFLFGELYEGSRWYYLPAAVLVKTPIGMLLLWLAGTVTMLAVPRLRAAALYTLVPAVVLATVAMSGARDYGVRYVVVVPLLMAVVAAAVVTVLSGRRRWAVGLTTALVAFVAVSSLRTFPYYLPYSNEAFGGPAKTHLRLHDSNVDWGQDLGRLADRLREGYPGEKVWLVYKGSGLPAAYGITASDPRTVPADQVHGLLVVSDSSIAKANGTLRKLLDGSWPIDEVGHSITIFRRP